jgi:hypothetical protein
MRDSSQGTISQPRGACLRPLPDLYGRPVADAHHAAILNAWVRNIPVTTRAAVLWTLVCRWRRSCGCSTAPRGGRAGFHTAAIHPADRWLRDEMAGCRAPAQAGKEGSVMAMARLEWTVLMLGGVWTKWSNSHGGGVL